MGLHPSFNNVDAVRFYSIIHSWWFSVLVPKMTFFATIEAVAFGGYGVAKPNGFTVFIPYTVDGDEILAEVVTTKKSYAFAKLISIVSPSPFRKEPLCPYFGFCGGCSYQHIQYEQQIKIKVNQLRDSLLKIGGAVSLPTIEIFRSPQEYYYRGKAEFHFGNDGQGKKILGLMRQESNEVVAIEHCSICLLYTSPSPRDS